MTNLSMNTMRKCRYERILFDRRSEEAGNERRIPYGKYRFCTGLQRTGYVQQMAPIFENLKGNFSGNMHIRTLLDNQMSPVMDTMQGNGSLSTQDLSLSGVKVIDQIAEAVKKPELKEMKVKDMALDSPSKTEEYLPSRSISNWVTMS